MTMMTKKPLLFGFGLLCLAAILAVSGCASDVDDPDDSEAILNVDRINPSNLEVNPTTATTTQTVAVTISATARVGDVGDFSDVTLDNYTIIYDPPMQSNPPVSVLNYPMTGTVTPGGSITVNVIAVSANQLIDGGGVTPNTQTNATIVVNGRDAVGNAASASGRFYILFKSIPSGDTDFDGILDDGDGSGIVGDNLCNGGNTVNCDDNCQFTVNPSQIDQDSDSRGDACDAAPLDPNIQ